MIKHTSKEQFSNIKNQLLLFSCQLKNVYTFGGTLFISMLRPMGAPSIKSAHPYALNIYEFTVIHSFIVVFILDNIS